MKQQSKGQGTISYDKVHNSYRAYYVTPAGRRISKRFKEKKEAAAWLADQQSKANSGNFTEPSNITLGSWLVTWIQEYKKAAISQRTLERYVELAGKCATVAGIKLQQLTVPQVQALYSQLAGDGLSAHTIDKVHKVLKAAMKKALQVGLVPRNIIDAVEPPKFERTHEIVTFTRTEVDAILSAAREHNQGRYYCFILLAITTGMRLGELLALRWSDLNPLRREVSISRNLQQAKSGIIINPPKTKAGRRTISIPAQVVSALQELKHGRKIESIDALIFVTSTGTPYSPRNIEHAWKRIMRRAGIPYRNFHVLRHTHCTDLLAAGVPIVEVARRVGHARISHTLELYGHAIPSYDKEIAGKVSNLYLVR